MPMVIIILIFAFILFKYFKNKSELENLLAENDKQEILDLNYEDKLFLQHLLKIDIKEISIFKKIKKYHFFVYKNQSFLNHKNINFDIVKVSISKLQVQKEDVFQISLDAWVHKSEYEMEIESDLSIHNIISNKSGIKNVLLGSMNGFFEKEDISNTANDDDSIKIL